MIKKIQKISRYDFGGNIIDVFFVFFAGDDIYRRLRGNDPYGSLKWSEYLINLHRLLIEQCGSDHNIPFFKWQKSFRDQIICDDNDYFNHLEYISHNALKHNLVQEPEEWKWMWVESMENSE